MGMNMISFLQTIHNWHPPMACSQVCEVGGVFCEFKIGPMFHFDQHHVATKIPLFWAMLEVIWPSKWLCAKATSKYQPVADFN